MVKPKSTYHYEIEKQKAIQQRQSPAQGRPREGNRTLWQTGQYEAVAGAQVEERLRPEEKQGGPA